MGHEIAEAVIENRQIKNINKKLPRGKIKVRIIYDTAEKSHHKVKTTEVVKETWGVYKDINVKAESRKLRKSWERNA